MKEERQESSLGRQLRLLMFFRVVTTTFLLGTTVVIQLREAESVQDPTLTALYVLIVSVYLLTFIYALVLPRFLSETGQAYIQIAGDILWTTWVIYLTGGLESTFSFMYILAVINSGILLEIRGAVLAASLSSIAYGLLLDLQFYGYIHPFLTRFGHPYFFRAADVLNKILVNMGAFYLVGVLSGYLARQMTESREKLAAQQTDLDRLTGLNESIVESIESGLMTLGLNGDVLFLNPAAERITGWRFAQIRGRPYRTVFPELNLDERENLPPGQTSYFYWTYHRSDGEELYLEGALTNIEDPVGSVWAHLLVFQDKTRIRRMEAEVKRVEKLALVGEMAASIAHEIRNPLASMSGSFQMLKAEYETESDRKRLLAIIGRELARLNNLVNDFLMFARPHPGVPAPVDLARLIEDNLRMFTNQAGQKGEIRIELDLQPGLMVYFDPHHLEQIMWNLLKNAAEAMPGGGVLYLTTGQDEEFPDSAVLAVGDTGPGIDPKDLPHIFDPFYTTKERGSGLGLSIVCRILEGGGGRIEADSRPGQGAWFTIFLPVYTESA
ncbi:MAG: PAS domain S-box protein [Proteobacteria bacterium]|nr:PAS domain S-box protein [Pseudomonadota bacterium]